jgi:Tfp pilus assembly protein PilO
MGANLLAYLAFTLPRSLQRRNLGQRLALAKEEVQRERDRREALKARYDLVTANTRDTTEFYQRRVSARGSSMVPILREIEALAKERGLQVGNQSFRIEAVKGAPLDQFQVDMPVRGTYREIVSFVQDLERSNQFITLDEVTVRGQQAGEAELKMVLSCYFRSAAGRQGT